MVSPHHPPVVSNGFTLASTSGQPWFLLTIYKCSAILSSHHPLEVNHGFTPPFTSGQPWFLHTIYKCLAMTSSHQSLVISNGFSLPSTCGQPRLLKLLTILNLKRKEKKGACRPHPLQMYFIPENQIYTNIVLVLKTQYWYK